MSREIGRAWERFVGDYLEEKGYRILEYNYVCKFGEIDIIALNEHKSELLFVEVKYRTDDEHGNPYEFVDRFKINKLEKAISCYLFDHESEKSSVCGKRLNDMDYRLDVISVDIEYDSEHNENIVLNHFENISF